ncbi:PAS domain S-box protein [Candidatus Methylospira mobilis]|uniref:PAS domain S-box protein n=1 Tax=Candidatus Methylospira mobilis TaxID=1808979 RepID=A0A5Q0BDS1_9GAMM|nr:PAS domain S-box protein [Candidatus Methylospira mobilis]QFY41282.1 PAS domain S-box protein [Candidatus Methylospira mobilis]WNV05496.1 PAS domain S-box protein [Candidatus Methylospira mobilis]
MLQSILNALEDGVCILDSGGRLLTVNSAALRMLGFQQDEDLSQTFAPVKIPATEFLASTQDHQQQTSELMRKDGSPLLISCTLDRIRVDQETDRVLLRCHPAPPDFTERRRAGATLQTLTRSVEKRLNAVLIADANGVIEYINPSYTRLTGYSLEDVVGQVPSELFPGVIFTPACEVLLGGSEWQGEIQGCKKTGELYWALQTISPIRNASGEISQYLAILQDISEIKRDKEALKESEERFRQVAEMVGEWLWEQDSGGHYIYCSSAVREILGYEPAEVLNKNYLDLLTPADKARWNHLASPVNHQPFSHLLNRYRHRDGHEVITESTGKPIFDAKGGLLKWRGVDHNVTERKLYEDALRLYAQALEAASVGIDISDARSPGYPKIYINPALSRITGYGREELLGDNMLLLKGTDTDLSALQTIAQAMSDGRHCDVVLKCYRKDGSPFWNELRISPVRDAEGLLTHFIGVHTDVTELRRASEERHELEIAKQIQMSLLPKRPLDIDRAAIAGVCLPATHVGGDYFDYFHTDNMLDLVIADVSGHSVGAALIMTEMRSALRAETRLSLAGGVKHGPAQILSLLNEVLYDDLTGSELFITMFYLRLDLTTLRLSYANAGHNCPLLSRANATACEPLDSDGLILGVKRNVVFEEKTLQIESGDRLLLYTDGVTEALNEQGEFFDVPRLCELFSSYRGVAPEKVIRGLVDALHSFRGAAPLADDVSMAVMNLK